MRHRRLCTSGRWRIPHWQVGFPSIRLCIRVYLLGVWLTLSNTGNADDSGQAVALLELSANGASALPAEQVIKICTQALESANENSSLGVLATIYEIRGDAYLRRFDFGAARGDFSRSVDFSERHPRLLCKTARTIL